MNDRTRMDERFPAAARVALAGALAMFLAACGGDPPAQSDGGHDSGAPPIDAGTDGGTPDAGPTDGGFIPELKITAILPPRAPSNGGVSVVIRGSGFVLGFSDRATEARKFTSIKFGSNPVQDFQIIDDGTIDARVPAGKAGLATVILDNPNGRAACENCFTYFDELFAKNAAPKEGPLRGGTEVTITGGGFTEGVQVLFGNVASPEVTVTSSTSLTAIAPRAVATDVVDITVYSKNGLGVLRRVYRYFDDLRVSDVMPNVGPLAGGTEVAIIGQAFDAATSVTFGGVEATFTVDSPTQITAFTPLRSTPGAVDVTITTPRDAWTARGAFSYVTGSGTALYGVFPHVGPASGGNVVTVMGEGLGAGNVTFAIGGVAAPVTSRSPNAVDVVVPPRGAGARLARVDMMVGGIPVHSLQNAYTYGIALSDLSPRNLPAAGGAAATLTGTGLPPGVAVHLGALAATVQSQVGETSASLVSPKGQGGPPTDVWAFDPADPENEAFLEDALVFDEAITIGRVQPDRGAIAGNTFVTVLGSGFGEATLVRFAGNVAKDIKVIDPHTLTCRTPKGNVGLVDVEVSRLGSVDTLPGGFAYFDPRSISGGLSGGPLTGTLNVTVLDSTPGFVGQPVPLALVVLGTDPFTPFQGPTDQRGQITFSDPSLVKPQTVTVTKDGYQSATVTSVNAENLTVYIARTGGDGSPAPPPPAPPPSQISGRVVGFKAPRPLGPSESLEARVFLAQGNLYSGTPWLGRLPNRSGQKWQVVKDGGEYLLFTSSGLRAAYAVLGIWNNQAQSFEPYLMGIRRGISVSPDNPATNQDIILDMHLDLTVPVTIDSPLSFGGQPAPNQLYAYLDLGAEGFIPNPNNWDTGAALLSSIESTGVSIPFPNFPQLDGSNFIFMNLSFDENTGAYSIFYRRQPGDMTKGVTVGPMLPAPRVTQPSGGLFNGTISWTTPVGAQPDIHEVSIQVLTLFGWVTLWTVVLPGTETQVALPPTAVQKLNSEMAGQTMRVQMFSSRSPKFSYNQWTYDTLSTVTWSSFTQAASEPFFP